MVKKVIYGGVLGMLGTETFLVGSKFYTLYKTGAVIAIAGGNVVCPYWLLFEGMMIGIAPILTRCIIRATKKDSIADDSDLLHLFQKRNKKKGDIN